MSDEDRTTMRLQFRATVELNEKYSDWAKELGMTKASFLALAAQIGANALMRQVNPEKFVTPELIESFRRAGYVVPDRVEGTENEK